VPHTKDQLRRAMTKLQKALIGIDDKNWYDANTVHIFEKFLQGDPLDHEVWSPFFRVVGEVESLLVDQCQPACGKSQSAS
jgi:hypothetical protein